MEAKFIMPKIWEIDGKPYEVSLSEGEIVAHTSLGKVIKNNSGKLIFKPLTKGERSK